MNKYPLILCALLAPVFGCGASGGSMAGGSSPKDNPYGNGMAGSSGSGYGAGGSTLSLGGSAGSSGSGGATTPPEQEQKLDFLAPQAGAHYVYVANPSRNTVSAINSTTLAITELAPGDSPTYVATVPGQDIALVINAGSHTLRILNGTSMNDSPIPIVTKANTISISPNGLHAVIWFDASQLLGTGGSAASTTATGSSQEVSVVDLSTTALKDEVVISMSVGLNPSAVVFSSDSTAAFVVTDDGISELRFANITVPAIAPFTSIGNVSTVSLASDAGAPLPSAQDTLTDSMDSGTSVDGLTLPIDGGLSSVDGGISSGDVRVISQDLASAPDLSSANSDSGSTKDATADVATVAPRSGKAVDVSVTSAGDYAIARREGSPELLLVNLKTHTVTSLMMSSPVTDLDLLPSGTQAFAVLRDESTLVRIDIPAGFTGGAAQKRYPPFDGVTIGSVTMSAKGKYALLYTTAIPSKSLVILDFAKPEYPLVVELTKAIRAISIAPDENSALVVHPIPTSSGSGGTTGQISSTTPTGFGYTMVRLEDGYRKPIDTKANPNPFAITPDSAYAFVLLRDDKASVRIAERISLTSFLFDDFPLGSPPNSIAALAGSHNVFVGQVYSEGRISFIDWVTGSVRTVTGFALNGRIQQ